MHENQYRACMLLTSPLVDQALQTYQTALQYFSTYLKYEKNAKVREAILEKASLGSSFSFSPCYPHLPLGSRFQPYSSRSTSKEQSISREQLQGRIAMRMVQKEGRPHKRSRSQEQRARRMCVMRLNISHSPPHSCSLPKPDRTTRRRRG